MDDVRRAVTMEAKAPGHLVYVLGETYDELGGSEWFAIHGFVGNRVPKVNAGRAKNLYNSLSRAIQAGVVASCHDCSDGGLGVALAETAFSGGFGMSVDLGRVPSVEVDRDDTLLFSESQSRFVVTVAPEAKGTFEKIMEGNSFCQAGKVLSEPSFKVKGLSGMPIIEERICDLKEAWQRPLRF
jgi:phosphoribosylformylglycinamidine synthase